MLSLECFIVCVDKLGILLQANTSNAAWQEAMYSEVAPFFDDNSFQAACREIAQGVDEKSGLYGKLPMLSHFMRYSPNKPLSITDERNVAKQALFDKVADYVSVGFHSTTERQDFVSGLTELEYRSIGAMGGISEIWARFNNPDYPSSLSNIQKQLGEFFDNNYTAAGCEKARIEERAIENKNRGLVSLGTLVMGQLEHRKDENNG